ncbi:MAG: hypothetical protein LBC74_00540 [Planctomycetaceae bacterium]|nr:hypothetical protein [Planctomycetaceae bacterium]
MANEMVNSTLGILYNEGKVEGIAEGMAKGKAEAILKILERRFRKIPDSISSVVNSYRDLIALESLLYQAIDCESLEEFEQNLAHN